MYLFASPKFKGVWYCSDPLLVGTSCPLGVQYAEMLIITEPAHRVHQLMTSSTATISVRSWRHHTVLYNRKYNVTLQPQLPPAVGGKSPYPHHSRQIIRRRCRKKRWKPKAYATINNSPTCSWWPENEYGSIHHTYLITVNSIHKEETDKPVTPYTALTSEKQSKINVWCCMERIIISGS